MVFQFREKIQVYISDLCRDEVDVIIHKKTEKTVIRFFILNRKKAHYNFII